MQTETAYGPDTQAPPDELASIQSARLVRGLIRGIPIVLAGLIFGVISGILILRVLPRSYTSSVSILLDPKRPGAYGADTAFGNAFIDVAKIANVELILVSSPVLLRVVRAEHLADVPAFGDASTTLFDRLQPTRLATPSPEPIELREDRAIRTLRHMIHTARVGATYVVTLDVTAPTASLAKRLAGDIANVYLAEQLDAKFESVQRDAAFLRRQINDERSALSRSSGAVEDLRKKLGVASIDATSDSNVDRVSITEINRQLAAAEGDLASAQARYEQAVRVTGHGGGDGLSEVTGSAVIAGLRSKQAAAAERLADLSVRYASGYPERKQAERDLAALDHNISLEVSRILSSLQNDYQAALTHRDVLKQQLAGLVRNVDTAASAEGRGELRDAERIAEADRITYEASLNRLRDVEQQQARQDVEARIISGPDLPDRPSAPKPVTIIGATTFLGFLIGAGAVLIMIMLRNHVDDVAQAENDLALPMLATVPYLGKPLLRGNGNDPSIPDYLVDNPFSLFGESFRLMRLRLARSFGRNIQVVQITSAVQGEGKSTVATSLAISAALSGIRTVLVDLDLYTTEASRLLGLGDALGVVDLLKGAVATAATLRNYRDLPLHAIAAGSIKSRHPSLIESGHLATLIEELRREYDLIILDTPPVLAISDPLFVARLVDATVLVVAWRATPQTFVTDAICALRKMHAPLAGLLLNKVAYKRTANYRHSYYIENRYVPAA
jgi:capsular exopolysaccharide synthesis family protein